MLNKGTADGHPAAGRRVPLAEWDARQQLLLLILTKFVLTVLHRLLKEQTGSLAVGPDASASF